MDWTSDDLKYLRSYKQIMDSDDIKIKEQIKKKLIDNKYIIHVLHNKELENAEAEADEYFGINILPYYMINPTQHNVENYLCYEVSYDELDRFNKSAKLLEIIFYVLSHNKDAIDPETGIARHDLLAALILNQFDWTNIFGAKIHCTSDRPSIVDNDYLCRTLIFQQITDNNVAKTVNGITRIVSGDVVQ